MYWKDHLRTILLVQCLFLLLSFACVDLTETVESNGQQVNLGNKTNDFQTTSQSNNLNEHRIPIPQNLTPEFRLEYNRRIYFDPSNMSKYEQANITVNIFSDRYYTEMKYDSKTITMSYDGTVCIKLGNKVECAANLVDAEDYAIVKKRFVQDDVEDKCIVASEFEKDVMIMCYENGFLANMSIEHNNGLTEIWVLQYSQSI